MLPPESRCLKLSLHHFWIKFGPKPDFPSVDVVTECAQYLLSHKALAHDLLMQQLLRALAVFEFVLGHLNIHVPHRAAQSQAAGGTRLRLDSILSYVSISQSLTFPLSVLSAFCIKVVVLQQHTILINSTPHWMDV